MTFWRQDERDVRYDLCGENDAEVRRRVSEVKDGECESHRNQSISEHGGRLPDPQQAEGTLSKDAELIGHGTFSAWLEAQGHPARA